MHSRQFSPSHIGQILGQIYQSEKQKDISLRLLTRFESKPSGTGKCGRKPESAPLFFISMAWSGFPYENPTV